MRFASERRRSQIRPDQRRIEFRRLRDERWNKLTLWRYLAILVIVILLLKFLYSLASSP